jgi:uncharacterized membrane protein
MKLFLRVLAGLLGAVLGGIVALVLQLFVGDGLQLVPIWAFLTPLIIGAAIGFCLGFVFYKAAVHVFNFVFNIEVG